MDRKKMALTVSTEFGEKHVLFVLRNYETVGQTGSPGMEIVRESDQML